MDILTKKDACRLLSKINNYPIRFLSRTLKKSAIIQMLSDNNIKIKMYESKVSRKRRNKSSKIN